MKLEIVSAIIIAVIAFMFVAPGNLTMPMGIQSMLIIGLVLSYLAFSALLLKEKGRDEREVVHIMRAGRISYLVGVGFLVIGIIIQAFQHNIDPWLIYALSAMVITKLVTRVYSHLTM